MFFVYFSLYCVRAKFENKVIVFVFVNMDTTSENLIE